MKNKRKNMHPCISSGHVDSYVYFLRIQRRTQYTALSRFTRIQYLYNTSMQFDETFSLDVRGVIRLLNDQLIKSIDDFVLFLNTKLNINK
jgi:hypothetical protein